MPTIGKNRATLFGLGALVMWTFEPLLISEINGLPIFEVLTIIFFSSFFLTAIRLTIKRRWHLIFRQPLFIWLGGFVGICVSDFAYLYASQFSPIAHVDLIDYLWPCFAIIFTGLLPKELFSLRYIFGALFGFLGIYFLIGQHFSLQGFNMPYFVGCLLAVGGAMLWGGYSAFSRHFKEVPSEMIGMYCLLGAILCALLHVKFEVFVIPSVQEASIAILTGITGAGIAYQLWDHGVKFGNIYLLSALTYAGRMFAMALLVLFGKEPLTKSLIFACMFASLGVYVSSLSNKSLQSFSKCWNSSLRFLGLFKQQQHA